MNIPSVLSVPMAAVVSATIVFLLAGTLHLAPSCPTLQLAAGLSSILLDNTVDIGILWTTRVGDAAAGEEWWTLKITEHLRKAYVGNIAYKYMHSPPMTERL
ncbi:hypothetical protein D9619_007696 [Psilocybe cf. subviscida]|uniref:Uncharacterized protein n=1 Tax=Psilocybe cf. subviscida TaxID=2480587 RepID=A0A8H5AUS9_9AGAR|nr:hypothetical protein D9619_007696 [Psilocybe cf. subviscida]